MENSSIEEWLSKLKHNQEDILNKINQKPIEIKRNSFLEPFDYKSYVDSLAGIPYGSSIITGTGNWVFGTIKKFEDKRL